MADHRPSASPRARSRQRRRRRDRSHDCARRVRHVHHVSSVRSGSAHPRPPYRRIEPTRASALRRCAWPDAPNPRRWRKPRRPIAVTAAPCRPSGALAGKHAARRATTPRPGSADAARQTAPAKKTGAAGARFLVMRSASPIADQGLLPSNMSMICRFSSGVTGGGVRPAAPAEPSASFALTVGLAAGLKSTLATKPAPGVRSA